MAPLGNLLKQQSDHFRCVVCVTAQHRQMLDEALKIFNITPDIDLNIMAAGQTLAPAGSRS